MLDMILATLLAAALGTEAPEPPSHEIEIPSVLVTLIDQRDVPAEEAGVLAAVDVREGQMVEQGDPLAQIVDTEARIAADLAKIELEIATKNVENDVDIRFARKSVDVAKAELQRSLDSIDKYPKSISDSEMDRLRLVVERAALEVEQAEYDLAVAALTRQIKENEHKAAQEGVRRRKITAPVAGVVVDVQRHSGEWVKPGDSVLRILRIDRLRAEGFLPVAELGGHLDGRPVRLIVDLPDQPEAEFPGELVFLSPEIDPVNAQVRVWAEIENRGLRLRPGMRARMIVELPPPAGAAKPN
jgi:macrolide-specific efflux system membrane fusion protein